MQRTVAHLPQYMVCLGVCTANRHEWLQSAFAFLSSKYLDAHTHYEVQLRRLAHQTKTVPKTPVVAARKLRR